MPGNAVRIPVTADDQASRPLNNVRENVNRLDQAWSKAGDKFDLVSTKIGRATNRIGSELYKLGTIAPGAIGDALGDAGMIASTAGEITIAGAAVKTLGVELTAASAGAALKWAAILGPLALVGAAGAAAAVGLEKFSEAQDRDLASSRAVERAQRDHALALGLFPHLFDEASLSADDYARATFNASERADELAHAQSELSQYIQDGIGHFNGWTIAAGNAGASLTLLTNATVTQSAAAEDSALSSLDQARGLDAVGIAAQRAAASLAGFLRASPTNKNLPGTADADRRFSFSSGGDADALAQAAANYQTSWDLAHPIGSGVKSAHGAATKAADDHAKAIRDKLNKAYDDLKRAAGQSLDDIHQKHLRAIDDARDLKNAALDVAEAEIRARTGGAHSEVDQLRADRRQRELEAAVAGAMTPEDRAQAVQALQDFLDDQRLARLDSDAQTAIDELEAQRQRNNDKADLDKQAENDRYELKKRALDDTLRLEKDHIDKAKGQWEKYFKELAGLAKKYGVDNILGIKETKPTTSGGKATEGTSQYHFYLDSQPINARIETYRSTQAVLRSSGSPSTGMVR